MSRKKDIAALDELFVEAGLYRKSEEYMELMQFIRRFRTLAPYNAFLIHMQRPDSRFVATAGEWRERFGRTVREGARPMVILMPFAPVWFVYDIEDTEGEPVREYLVDPWACGGRLPSNHWENLLQNLARMGIHYREEALDMRHAGRIESSGRDGAWLPLLVGGKEKKVRLYATLTVNARLSPEAKLVTAAHELGHYLCGHMASPDHEPPAWDDDPQRPGWEYRPDDPEISLRRREFEAESVAWLVCERLELINPSARYLAHYVGERGEIPNVSLDAILKAAGQIETMLRRVLPVDRYRLISEESEERARRGRS